MPLTYAILSFWEGWSDDHVGKYARAYFEQEADAASFGEDPPPAIKHTEAMRLLRIQTHGMTMTPAEQRRADMLRWVRDQQDEAIRIYTEEYDSLPGAVAGWSFEILGRRKMIARTAAKWRKYPDRQATVQQALEAQIRGAFLEARKRGEDNSGWAGRLDPEWVFDIRSKKAWERARGWAQLYWTQQTFEEE